MDGAGQEPIDLARARTSRAWVAPPDPMPVVMPAEVEPLIAALYRTEDIAVAPDGRRVVIPGFFSDHMLLVDLDVVPGDHGASLHVSNPTVVQCERLRFPHGAAFVDETTVIVANRGAELMAIDVPAHGVGPTTVFRTGRVLVDERDPVPVRAPSSLALRVDEGLAEVLVCNNDSHTVTRYVLDVADDLKVLDREVLIGEGLTIPDGIAISRSGRWIAVSNHQTHEVFVYTYEPGSDAPAHRVGTLRGANYPHGVRFADEDRAILLNDAGLPHLYVYRSPDGDWGGTRDPVRTLRVMDDDTFNAGRYNPQEGGPKGLVVLDDQRAIVQTSTHQHLACLMLDDVLDGVPAPSRSRGGAVTGDPTIPDLVRRSLRRLQDAEAELDRSRRRVAELEQRFAETEQRFADEQRARHDLEGAAADAAERARSAEATADALRTQLDDMVSRAAQADEELEALRGACRRAEAELEALRGVCERAEAELEAIRRSTSWRATRPMRTALDILRRR